METQAAYQILEGLLSKTKQGALEWRRGLRKDTYMVSLVSGPVELRMEKIPDPDGRDLLVTTRRVILRERESEKVVLNVDETQDGRLYNSLILSLITEVQNYLAKVDSKLSLEPFLKELSGAKR